MDQQAYILQLERKLRHARRRADAAMSANIILSIACVVLVLLFTVYVNA